jgi:hypothetical protein
MFVILFWRSTGVRDFFSSVLVIISKSSIDEKIIGINFLLEISK